MTRRILAGMGLLAGPDRTEVGFQAAPRGVLERFHTARYLDTMQRAAAGDLDVAGLAMGFGRPEVPVFREMYTYAALACGATLRGADLLLAGEADVAFNPSGGYHHARPEMAAGFCYMNDVALACLALAERVDRVLFLDVDVHHGDGVQDAFYGRRDVMTMSLHETATPSSPARATRMKSGRARARAPASTCRCRLAPMTMRTCVRSRPWSRRWWGHTTRTSSCSRWGPTAWRATRWPTSP